MSHRISGLIGLAALAVTSACSLDDPLDYPPRQGGVEPPGITGGSPLCEIGAISTWKRQQRFSPEVRERAIRLVREKTAQHRSQWAAIEAIAPKLGCTSETPRRWVRDAERAAGERPSPTRADTERLQTLKRENRELKRANAIMGKASAFCAAAEVERRSTA